MKRLKPAKIDPELAETERLLRNMRKEALLLKADYSKTGNPKSRSDYDALKFSRREWEWLWRRERSHHVGQNGGYRPGSGRKKTGKTTHSFSLSLPIEICERISAIPRGKKARYISEALEFYFTVKPPEEQKKPPPRGRHAVRKPFEPKRPCRMNSLELARYKLDTLRKKLAAYKANSAHPSTE